MAAVLKEIIKLLDLLYPPELAESWDKVGLQVGDPEISVRRVLLALDVNEAVIGEALAADAQLILSHHPLIFSPLSSLRTDDFSARLVTRLIRGDLAHFAAHTNLDRAVNGLNDILADLLALNDVAVLQPGPAGLLRKLVVFVPEEYLDRVRQAICQAGGGGSGSYSCCTFAAPGQGTFVPLAGSQPFIGRHDELTRVSEYRLETILPARLTDQVLKAMRQSHPYEEVAFDLYDLERPDAGGGLGRLGNLARPLPLGQLAARVKEALGAEAIHLIGDPEAVVSRAAVCGGSGAHLIGQAKALGAQCLITGDVRYHQALEAASLGLGVIDAGHYSTEHAVLQPLAGYLHREFLSRSLEVAFIPSQVEKNPWICC